MYRTCKPGVSNYLAVLVLFDASTQHAILNTSLFLFLLILLTLTGQEYNQLKTIFKFSIHSASIFSLFLIYIHQNRSEQNCSSQPLILSSAYNCNFLDIFSVFVDLLRTKLELEIRLRKCEIQNLDHIVQI